MQWSDPTLGRANQQDLVSEVGFVYVRHKISCSVTIAMVQLEQEYMEEYVIITECLLGIMAAMMIQRYEQSLVDKTTRCIETTRRLKNMMSNEQNSSQNR